MSQQHDDEQNQYDESYDYTAEDVDYSGDTDVTDAEWVDDVDDHHLDDDVMDDEEFSSAPPQKKSSALRTIIVVVAVVLGGLGYLFVKGNGNQTTSTNIATGPTQQAPQQTGDAGNDLMALRDAPTINAPEQVTAESNQIHAAQGLMDEPQILDQPIPATDTPANAVPALPDQPMTAPEAIPATETVAMLPSETETPATTAPVTDEIPVTTTEEEPVADLTSTPQEQPATSPAALVDTITPAVKPTSDFPTVAAIKKPATTTQPVTVDIPEPAPANTPPSVDATEKEFGTNMKISDLETALEAEKTKSEGAAREISNLKQELSDLKEKLKAEQAKPATTVKKETSVAAEPVVKSSNARITKAKTAPSSNPAPNWTLKSAKPGRAVLANKATGDYKTVSVGDTVAGIGRITLISETPSGWIVKGTQSSIKE